MNTLYLAGPYAARDSIRRLADEVTRIGYDVTSTWLQEDHKITPGTTGPADDLSDEQAADHALIDHALIDFADIDRADTFVLITQDFVSSVLDAFFGGGSGGRHVETGYFIARKTARDVIVVGAAENIFHRLPGITVVPNWHQAVVELASRLNAEVAAS